MAGNQANIPPNFGNNNVFVPYPEQRRLFFLIGGVLDVNHQRGLLLSTLDGVVTLIRVDEYANYGVYEHQTADHVPEDKIRLGVILDDPAVLCLQYSKWNCLLYTPRGNIKNHMVQASKWAAWEARRHAEDVERYGPVDIIDNLHFVRLADGNFIENQMLISHNDPYCMQCHCVRNNKTRLCYICLCEQITMCIESEENVVLFK